MPPPKNIVTAADDIIILRNVVRSGIKSTISTNGRSSPPRYAPISPTDIVFPIMTDRSTIATIMTMPFAPSANDAASALGDGRLCPNAYARIAASPGRNSNMLCVSISAASLPILPAMKDEHVMSRTNGNAIMTGRNNAFQPDAMASRNLGRSSRGTGFTLFTRQERISSPYA